MQRPTNPAHRLLTLGCLVAVALVAAPACAPPLSAGYVPVSPRHAGAVNVSLQGGAGYPPLFYGGAIHADFFFTPTLSVPVSLGGARMEGRARGVYDYFVSGRMGFRHRPSSSPRSGATP